MLSFLRAPLPPRTNTAADNPVIYEDGSSSLEFRSAGSEYLLRNVHPPFDPTKPQSIMVPPFHYHINQTQHFRIVEGSCHLFCETADKPCKTLSAEDPDASKTAVIPKKLYHTINNASATAPLVLDVNLSPEDLRWSTQPPSIFQLMVFLRAADTPLGLSMPTKWLGIVVSRAFLVAMGLWGYWILGYKATYPEYYTEKQSV